MGTATLPGVDRKDAGLALVGPLYVGSPHLQQKVADAIVAEWAAAPRPEGLLSQSCYVSTDGENVWTYEQWTELSAYRATGTQEPPAPLRGLGPDGADIERCAPTPFQRYRSRVYEPSSVPTRFVAPAFDTDGRAPQRGIIDALLDGPLTTATPGLIAAHFHYSLDGGRVLNFAEFTEDSAHEFFLDSPSAQVTTRITQDMPGVRGIGGRRYVLHGSVVTVPPAAG
ncbi:monooxygenase [Streptomyces sp. NPDC005791]|uniref:monooxygenase n=1 Tax=Streptomyces sp. NPDC005791 TaxID=3364732 RepID=UPI0036C1BC72